GSIAPSGAIVKDYDQDQLFTATANLGYEVDTWSVDGNSVQVGGGTYNLTNITADHTLNVTFKVQQFTVTASSDANGSIAPSGAIVKDYDQDQLFTATANLGYEVDTWSVDGNSVQSGGDTYTLTNITAAHTVHVTFKLLPPQLTVTASAGANGSIIPSGAVVVDYGQDQLFTATANLGYEVDTWSVDGNSVQIGGGTYTLTNVTADHTLNVTFKVQQFTVTASSDANGSIAPSGAIVVNYGDNQMFEATPNYGYYIGTWYLDGNSVKVGSKFYTLSDITADHTVYLTFVELPQYTVTASADGNGSIDPNGAIVVYSGDSQLFTATANLGYEVDTWYLNGFTSQVGGDTYTLDNIVGNKTVLVTFKLLQYTITANSGANGSISPSGAVVVDYGMDQLFTASPDIGYEVDTWSVDGNSVQIGGDTYTLTNVTATHTVDVTFVELPQYTVTASAGANGSIAPSGAVVVNHGDSQLFTATANLGYEADTWSVDGNSVQVGGGTYTLTNITADHTVDVTFKLQQFTVTASADANGTIDPNGAIAVNYGADQLFTATANPGYKVDAWYVDGNSVQTNGDTYTLTNVTDVHTVHVTFMTDIFYPNQVLTFNITMDPNDWDALRASCPNGICPYPQSYWQATLESGVGPMLVGICRKNDLAEPSEADPQKVSLEIDVDLYVPDQLFEGKKKLSLECGSEGSLVSEGLSWNIYQAAGFISSRAAWCKVYVNGSYKGLYANVEQVDKVFLGDKDLNHGGFLWKAHELLGEQQMTRGAEISPFAFNWYPFDHPNDANNPEVPAPVDWWERAQWLVDIPHLLTLATAENFISNTEGAVQKMTNYWYYDWSTDVNGIDPNYQRPRLYLPWDLNATLNTGEINRDVLYPAGGSGHLWQGLIDELDEAGTPFAEPAFQAEYLNIYRNLMNGPLALSNMLAMVNNIETVIAAEVDADPYTQLGSAATEFQRIRDFLQDRTDSVNAQLDVLVPPPGTILLDDGFEGAVWNANWTGTWVEDTSTYFDGTASAHAYKTSYGDFTCIALDTSDAGAIHVDFWLQKNNISSFTAKLYYYNGTSYVDISDIDTFGADDEWIHYTDTITDSNYFVPDFQIRFSATLSGGGPARDIWIDNMVITKEITPCAAANLDGAGLVNINDFGILASDWDLTLYGLAGDIDANNVVNFADLEQIMLYWLSDCQP
ncbi:MAG: InlB B-repeat-containing protein, partial [Planctomycetota bacterium]